MEELDNGEFLTLWALDLAALSKHVKEDAMFKIRMINSDEGQDTVAVAKGVRRSVALEPERA